MFLFSFIISYRSPVILLPPFYGTNLWVTYNNTNLPWYCHKAENDSLLWLSSAYFGPFQMRCLFKLMTSFIDDNGNIQDWPNTTINIHDFGGLEGAKYIIQSKLLKKGFFPSLLNFAEHFKSLGWELGKDLFIAPYDWRIGQTFSDDIPDFFRLTKLVSDIPNFQMFAIFFINHKILFLICIKAHSYLNFVYFFFFFFFLSDLTKFPAKQFTDWTIYNNYSIE